MVVLKNSEINMGEQRKRAVALGSFDALHVGHTKLIRNAIEIAKNSGCESMVQLFRIPPGGYNENGVLECVNSLEKRLEILDCMGVDVVVLEEFDDAFRKTGYKDFVKEYIAEKYNAFAVCAGYNYRFGFHAQGDAESLIEECARLGIDVFIQDCVKLDKTVSSTVIREMIRSGDMEKVKLYLGRPFSLSGQVIKGRQLGRKMGFPTANINLPQGIVIPAEGVYKTCIYIDGIQYDCITNVGHKPTVSSVEQNCETHIIGFDGDLYDRNIEIEFSQKLRDIVEFDSIEKLKAQLERDLKKVTEI